MTLPGCSVRCWRLSNHDGTKENTPGIPLQNSQSAIGIEVMLNFARVFGRVLAVPNLNGGLGRVLSERNIHCMFWNQPYEQSSHIQYEESS